MINRDDINISHFSNNSLGDISRWKWILWLPQNIANVENLVRISKKTKWARKSHIKPLHLNIDIGNYLHIMHFEQVYFKHIRFISLG